MGFQRAKPLALTAVGETLSFKRSLESLRTFLQVERFSTGSACAEPAPCFALSCRLSLHPVSRCRLDVGTQLNPLALVA